ncbi:Adenosylcobinamide kinase [uncultured Roseburia sp.]|uniref:Bifunctional adenosylcobinamide kinase/adenosylcobinamide-phosphate guanylyltransferase n=1 Tax=Brotonthovivens ammoniilytica TaxID=2981725 RepID=A0ABT2TLG8_9FIRM|nr:bifunctional adenosylcobinamide kinase/adenosylcobinamide-phosphate guanylyltransferase [Brotonthovivens ammoniilytica]MCU6763055.1 bifunctional adenosylcobinamide kinase/adenosylcobinamide-phosphate guanylyltransferase [Brotonthovivens ammoniilytica]SCJ01792.1 Adenosylcobinamide kinase [uncultured Roseburia sp.]
MVLITGGSFQGKQAFAKETFQITEGIADGAAADFDELCRADLIINFEQWIARELREKNHAAVKAGQLAEENPGVVICAAELGCGIVPADAFDRQWRETTGRICCMLAEKSDAVYRVICGIGTKIKGEDKE